jgi:hypothetical protein
LAQVPEELAQALSLGLRLFKARQRADRVEPQANSQANLWWDRPLAVFSFFRSAPQDKWSDIFHLQS